MDPKTKVLTAWNANNQFLFCVGGYNCQISLHGLVIGHLNLDDPNNAMVLDKADNRILTLTKSGNAHGLNSELVVSFQVLPPDTTITIGWKKRS